MALAPGMAASMVGRRGGLAVTGYRGRLRSERGLRTGRTVVAQWGEYSAPRPGARPGASAGIYRSAMPVKRDGSQNVATLIRSRTDGDALLVARFSAEANRLLERRIVAHSAVRMRVRVLGHVRVCTDFVSSIVGARRPPGARARRHSDSMRVLAQPIPLRNNSIDARWP